METKTKHTPGPLEVQGAYRLVSGDKFVAMTPFAETLDKTNADRLAREERA